MIRAQSADGKIHEFPDGTSDAVVDRVMRNYATSAKALQKKQSGLDVAEATVKTAARNFLPGYDEAADAIQSGINVLAGRQGSFGEAWNATRSRNSNQINQFAQDRPLVAAGGRGVGMAGGAAIPVGRVANAFAAPLVVAGRTVAPVVAGAARGATTAGATGAAYAAAGEGSAQERISAASRAATDPVSLTLGAVVGGAAGYTPRPKVQAKTGARPNNRAILAESGVSTTPAQGAGRAIKSVEDLGKRAPIVGPAMMGYQDRQIEQLNRAVGLHALKPVGLGIPKEIKPGFEMVEYVDDQLGSIYSRAADMVPVARADDALVSDLQAIAARKADLAESEARQFDSIIGDRLNRLSSGEASGATVKKIHEELGKLQREAARKGQDTLSSMLGETRRAVVGLIERANPEARALIARADEGWRIYSMMNDAASAASARGGVFLPGQLNTQVRRSAKGMGSNMSGKGKGPLQDLSTAASQTIPDSYGNPGTANALGMGAGGVGLLTEPVTTVTAAAGLTAAATPYFLAGRKVLESLPSSAGRQELEEAARQLAQLAVKDPSVRALQSELAARLARTAGITSGAQQNALAANANPAR